MCPRMAFFTAICPLPENIQFYRWIVVLKFSNAAFIRLQPIPTLLQRHDWVCSIYYAK